MSSQKTIIVTGANCGIGYEVTKLLCQEGHNVIMACRNKDRAEEAITKLKRETPDAKLEFMELDMASVESIRSFADKFIRSGRQLDVLTNNAGVFLIKPGRETSKDGLELTMATNYVGPYLLTHLLLPELKKTAETKGEARVVIVVSSLHDIKIASMGGRRKVAPVDPEDLELKKPDAYNGYQAYKNSKAASVMFAQSCSRLLEGSGVTINSLCPGFIPGTELSRDAGWGTRFFMRYFLDGVMKIFVKVTKTPKQGGEAVHKLAADPSLKGVNGKYYSNNEQTESSDETKDGKLQEILWTYANNAANVDIAFPAIALEGE